MATDYAKINGTYIYNDNYSNIAEKCYWWLRSPGRYTDYAACMDYGYWGIDNGYNVINDTGIAVRPAMHVNLSSSCMKDAGKVTSTGDTVPSLNRDKADDFSKPTKMDDVTTWDCVYFGNYKQKSKFEKDNIEWRVLSVNGKDAFVIADKALDCKPYNDKGVEKSYSDGGTYIDYSCTWETCTLNEWLNGTGDYENKDDAFTDEEKSAIIRTTMNKIYLLSVAEASNIDYGFDETFIKNSVTRRTTATDYEKVNGRYVSNSSGTIGNCYWWLRTTGEDSYKATYVSSEMRGDYDGINVESDWLAVRPALHVDLSSSYVKSIGTVSVKCDNMSENLEAQTKADTVIEFISSIGEVTKDSDTAIERVRAAYDALPENAKELVVNYSVLVAAESKYDEIVKGGRDNSGLEKNDGDSNDKNGSGNSSSSSSTTQISGNFSTSTTQETPVTAITPATSPTEQIVKESDNVSISSAKNSKKNTFVIKWKKVDNAKGYEVQYALNKKFTKGKKTKNITVASKVSFTAKKLKKGKIYYVRVRAYNTSSKGSKVYGKWSTVKKVKIKK